uniref:glucan 1,3-beta-glucosidase n=1 Tax=Globisporangium ultimum (strain ATCC 200006 / CBS 805.95 / DAOM BR144) TaxID=431595 RepID=K3X945_GLOUD
MVAHENSLQARIRRGEIPCRGANVGGWLVAESWMTWDSVIWENVPPEISCQGEFATMKFLGHDRGDARFEAHRSTWIREDDIAEMKRFGLNTVRVPVGFWLMGYDPTDVSNKQEWKVFAPNALKFLDQLVNKWSVRHDMAVLIDIHAAKGSQNGRDHSAAPTSGVKYWSEYPENVENTMQFACFLAARYHHSPSFFGLGLLNEPEYPVDQNVLRDYYTRTYNAIRSTGNDCVLVVAPMLTEQRPPFMEDFMNFPQFFNVWHEWHPYFLWGYEGQSKHQVLHAVQQYANQVLAWQGNWLLISEWSLASPDSAFRAEDREGLQRLAAAQLKSFEHAHSGWTFWSWRHSDDGHNKPTAWSLRQLMREGILKLE